MRPDPYNFCTASLIAHKYGIEAGFPKGCCGTCCPLLPFTPVSNCMMPPRLPLKEKAPSYALCCVNGLV